MSSTSLARRGVPPSSPGSEGYYSRAQRRGLDGVAMRADLSFMNNLRPESPPRSRIAAPSSTSRRGAPGMASTPRGGKTHVSDAEVDALLLRLANGSPSLLKEVGLTPRSGRKPAWVTTPLKLKEPIWKPVEAMEKPPSSSRRTPSRVLYHSSPAALASDDHHVRGDGSSNVSPAEGGIRTHDAPDGHSQTPVYVNAMASSMVPGPSPGGNVNAFSSASRTPGWDEGEDDEWRRELEANDRAREAVFERLYRQIPAGQRKKFHFPDDAPPDASVLTPEGGRHFSKTLAEKRREIDLLRAELATRELTDSAGEAAAAAAAAEYARRRGEENFPVIADDETRSMNSEEAEEAAAAAAASEVLEELARRHGAANHISARPTDVPVTRFEDDPDFVDWELATSFAKKPWQERLRVAEEKRALKALAWEEEVRARAAAKLERQRLVVEAEAELDRLQKRKADILVRQRHKKAMANTKVNPKSVPRSRPPWGYTGSPGTVDNVVRSSPGVGRAFGRSYPSPGYHAERSSSLGTPGPAAYGKENATPGSAVDGRLDATHQPPNRPAAPDASEYLTPAASERSAKQRPPPGLTPSYGGVTPGSLHPAAPRTQETSRPRPRSRSPSERTTTAAAARRATAAAAILAATTPPPDTSRTPTYVNPADAARAAARRVKEREAAAAAAAAAAGRDRSVRRSVGSSKTRLAGRVTTAEPQQRQMSDRPAGQPPREQQRRRRERETGSAPVSRKLYEGSPVSRDADGASTVAALSEEVTVLRGVVKEQGMHVAQEIEGMKQQMNQMFEMMQRVMAAASAPGVGAALAASPAPPKSPSDFVSG